MTILQVLVIVQIGNVTIVGTNGKFAPNIRLF